jgi:hypothetical protein
MIAPLALKLLKIPFFKRKRIVDPSSSGARA